MKTARSLLDGLVSGYRGDSEYVRIVENDLRTGQHRNATSRDYFTTAFFHLPEELEREVTEAGLVVEELLGVEGRAGMGAVMVRPPKPATAAGYE